MEELNVSLDKLSELFCEGTKIRDQILLHSRALADVKESFLWLKNLSAKERLFYRQELDGVDFMLSVRDEECLILNDEVKRLRSQLDATRNENACLQRNLYEARSKARQMLAAKEVQVRELKKDNHHLRRRLAKPYDSSCKETTKKSNQSFFSSVQATDFLISIDKELADKCAACLSKFTFFVRKHFCHMCRKILCRPCSSFRPESRKKVLVGRLCRDCSLTQSTRMDSESKYCFASSSKALERSKFDVGLELGLDALSVEKSGRFEANGEFEANLRSVDHSDFLTSHKSAKFANSKSSDKLSFDEITDEEIANSLSATSPYTGVHKMSDAQNYFGDEFLTDDDALTLNSNILSAMDIARHADGSSAEFWLAPEFKFGLPLLAEKPCRLRCQVSSNIKTLSFIVAKQDQSRQTIAVTMKEIFLRSSTPFTNELHLSEGLYILVFTSYSRFLPTKLMYNLKVEAI